MDSSNNSSEAELRDELQRLRSRLNASQQLLDSYRQASSDCVAVVDKQHLILDWNLQASRLFGWECREVVGRHLGELIIPDSSYSSFQQCVDQTIKDSDTATSDACRLIVRDRQGTEYQTSVVVISTDAIQPGSYQVIFRVMSDRKFAMRTLLDKEAEIKSLLQSSAEGIYGVNLEGECTFANNACAELLGYESTGELVGKNIHELIHHSDAQGVAIEPADCQILRAFREDATIHVEDEVFYRSDGSSFPIEYWSTPIQRGDQTLGCIVTFVDITLRHNRQLAQLRAQQKLERKVDASESELAATKDRLALALTRANIGLWDWNAETNEVYFSPTYKTQLGYPGETPWRDFEAWKSRLHPDDVDGAMECVEKYFRRESTDYRSTFRMQCRDGSYRWFLAQGNADFDDQGKPQRVMGVHVDITSQVRDEQELKRLNEALRESNLELQHFASVASHDLQAPLRSIGGFAQFLLEDYAGKLDASADDYLNRIVRNAQRMQRLIDDLLAFSRVESRTPSQDPVNLNDALDDALQSLHEVIESTEAIVTRDSLPTVNGDAVLLTQLFENLISNALKYQDANTPHVHISTESSDQEHTISVTDNGIGISPDYQDRIFEIFRRLHTQKTFPGSGIGLALCRRIVTRHGGIIGVRSEPEHGSTFYFTLPVHRRDQDEKNSETPH